MDTNKQWRRFTCIGNSYNDNYRDADHHHINPHGHIVDGRCYAVQAQ
jgi:hypothetical protein